MSGPLDIRLRYLPLRSVAAGTLSNPALWYTIGDPLESSARLIKFDNTTNQDVLIGVNGVNAFAIVPSGSFFLIDISTNRTTETTLVADEGTQYWAQPVSVPSSGSVYVTALGAKH